MPLSQGSGLSVIGGLSLRGGLSVGRGFSPVLGPTLNLQFTTGILDSRITFTRASSATYFDSSGLLQTAGTNVPRFTYDPVSLAAQGLLIEEARTNVVLQNRDLTNVAWVKTTATAALNQTGIDGVSNSASSLTAAAGNATAVQAIVLGSSARFQTAYVKRLVGSGVIQMTMDNGATWTTVTVTAGWTRVSIPTQTLANPIVGFRIVTSGDSIAIDYVQNENGTFATSAIAVSGTAVARSADIASMTGTNFSSWFNQSEGTFVVEYSCPILIGGVISANDGSFDNRYSLRANQSTAGTLFVTKAGVTEAAINVGSLTYAPVKSAMAYKVNDIALANAGLLGQIDTAAALPTVDRMNIGTLEISGQPLDGTIKSIRYYPTRLSNAQLQALST
jgi:hypothetical protein